MEATVNKSTDNTLPKVAVIGGGFAGLRAIRALRRVKCEITLFDPQDSTAMLPALPDLAGGWLEPNALTAPMSDLLPPNVIHAQQTVSTIRLDTRTIVADEWTEEFGYIVITSGAKSPPCPFDTEERKAYTLDSVEAALRIKRDFGDYLAKTANPCLVIAGGGYTGLELSVSLAERARQAGKPCRAVVLEKNERVLPILPQDKLDTVVSDLAKAGIEIITETEITSWDGRNLAAGSLDLEDVFLCWTVGTRFAIPNLEGAVEQLPDGRLKVEQDLSLPGYPHIFVAGDAAAIEHKGATIRKAVNFAWYGGHAAGRNIADSLRNRPTKGFRPLDLGWVIPLHKTGVGLIFGRVWVRGRLSLRLHYLMCGLRSLRLAGQLRFFRTALTLFK